MSLILDALNRAEQERNEKNHIPTLQSMHSPGDKVAPSLLQRLHLERWLIGLVVAYLVFDFFRDRMPDPAAVLSPPAEQTQLAPAPAAGAAAIVAQPEAVSSAAGAASSMPGADTVASIQDAPSERVVDAQGQPAAVKAEPNKPLAAKPPARSDAERRPSVTQSQTRIDASAAIAKPVTKSQPPVAAQPAPNPKVESLYRAPQESSARGGGSAPGKSDSGSKQRPGGAFLRAQQITDLALTLRQQIPSLKYSDHSPEGRSAERQVVLNGNVYKENDTVVPGLRLVEISDPGIVLEFEGERFRLSAYNSWINFQ